MQFHSVALLALVATVSAIYDPNAPPMPEGGVGMNVTEMMAVPTAQKTSVCEDGAAMKAPDGSVTSCDLLVAMKACVHPTHGAKVTANCKKSCKDCEEACPTVTDNDEMADDEKVQIINASKVSTTEDDADDADDDDDDGNEGSRSITGQGPKKNTIFRKIGDGFCADEDLYQPDFHFKYGTRDMCQAYCFKTGPACEAYDYIGHSGFCRAYGSKIGSLRTPSGWRLWGSMGRKTISTFTTQHPQSNWLLTRAVCYAKGQGPQKNTIFRKIGDGFCADEDLKVPDFHFKYGARNNPTWCQAYCFETGPACEAYDYIAYSGFCRAYGSMIGSVKTPLGWQLWGSMGRKTISTFSTQHPQTSWLVTASITPVHQNNAVCYAKEVPVTPEKEEKKKGQDKDLADGSGEEFLGD